MELTPKQQLAVQTEGKSILISAAAGSGKTSVLTQRVLYLIERGADIRRMLICTFANAAANEMARRIETALTEKAQSTGDRRLAAQAEYARIASICTMHSFAISLCREYTAFLGLSPKTRVASEEEALVLRERAMEAVFDQLSEEEDESLLLLRDSFWSRGDDHLKSILLKIYAQLSTMPENIRWLERLTEHPVSQALRQSVLEDFAFELSCAADLLEQSAAIAGEALFGEQDAAYAAALRQQAALAHDPSAWEAFLTQALEPPPLKGMKRTPAADAVKGLRKSALKIVAKWQEETPQAILASMEAETPYFQRQNRAFLRVLRAFQEVYTARKQERTIMDLDDAFAYASAILADDSIADQVRGRFDYVFIDEFQDTNNIQEYVFSRISREDNRFIVGDVKQSIYRFRLANPLIFKDKAADFEKNESVVIHMNDNFRSAPEIIRPLNYIMGHIMSPRLGEVAYTAEESLEPRGDFSGRTEVLLTANRRADKILVDGVALSGAEKEAHTIARKIRSLIGEVVLSNGQPLTIGYEHIAVLCRSLKNRTEMFRRVFRQYRIPLDTEEEKYDPPEVLLFVSLLKTVESFDDEIALLSVMRSFVGGFDEEEMASIRLLDQEASFSACFQAYGEIPDEIGKKCAALLEKIGRWRLMADNLRLTDFLILLKAETDFAPYVRAMEGGLQRLANFNAFFEQCLEAAKKEAGLYGLVSFLDGVREKNQCYSTLTDQRQESRAVRLMTIHKSKGLEFPVVILAMANPFAAKKEDPLLIHPGLGICSKMLDTTENQELPSQVYAYFRQKTQEESLSEELRLLYVAMTRAKNILVISGSVASTEKLFEKCSPSCSPLALKSTGSMLYWIMSALFHLPCFSDWVPASASVPQDRDALSIPHAIVEPYVESAAEEAEARPSIDLSQLRQRLAAAAAMPCPAFVRTELHAPPAKIGVSSLLPAFIWEELHPGLEEPQGPRQPSGAAAGDILHLFLEKFDFSGRQTVEQMASGLLEKGIITKKEQTIIKRFAPNLARFAQSSLAERVRKAERVLREAPFTLAERACDILPGEASQEKVLVQGIIDLAFLEGGQWVLVDYKSNMAGQDSLPALTDHYRKQIRLYRRALERISGFVVKEAYLYFIRLDQPVLIT